MKPEIFRAATPEEEEAEKEKGKKKKKKGVELVLDEELGEVVGRKKHKRGEDDLGSRMNSHRRLPCRRRRVVTKVAGRAVQRVKHVPQRTCVGCRTVMPKRQLVRIVRTADGVLVDPTGKRAGRGAYLHDRRSCWEAGLQGSLARALKVELDSGGSSSGWRRFVMRSQAAEPGE